MFLLKQLGFILLKLLVAVYKIFLKNSSSVFMIVAHLLVSTKAKKFNKMLKMKLQFVAELLQKGSDFWIRALPMSLYFRLKNSLLPVRFFSF